MPGQRRALYAHRELPNAREDRELADRAGVDLFVGVRRHQVVEALEELLDLFTLRVPGFFGSIQSKGAQKGGHVGALLMGVAAGFIAAPCTAPVLGLLLIYVARQGSVLWGGFLLFVFSIGLSFLLMMLGIFSGMLSSLPRSGSWMNYVKKTFGVLMIVIGAFFLWKAVSGVLA